MTAKNKTNDLNFVTVEYQDESVTFVYASHSEHDAKKAFHELCHWFDGIGYHPCYVQDEHGNKLAKLESIYINEKEEGTLSDFLGGLFAGLVIGVTILMIIF